MIEDPQENKNSDIQKRLKYLGYIILGLMALIVLRLWFLQVIMGSHYRELSENNRLRVVRVSPPRGIIYDREGIPLVENIPSFDISLVLEDIPKGGDTISRLSKLLGIQEEDIKKKIGLAKRKDPFQPIKIKEDVGWEEVAKVEARRVDMPGVFVEVEVTRNYMYGDLGSHIIGFLGRITAEQAEIEEYSNFPRGSLVGQWGIEKSFDSVLKGIPGERIIEVDALGREVRVIGERDSIPGDDIYLTIDLRTQKITEDALGKEAGAIVAMDPNNGEILALSSRPSPDPNIFSKGIQRKDWVQIINDPLHPLMNRAIQSQVPPGSTFKIVMAAAGLESGKITPSTEVTCQGAMRFGNRDFRCWKAGGHGRVSLHRAIVESCDVYFYELGKKLGIDLISDYAVAFGFGKVTGIPLPSEKTGLVPSTEWKKKTQGKPWFPGETIAVSIGQGYLLVTPIQMAQVVSAVANDGVIYKPKVVKRINGKDGYIDFPPEGNKVKVNNGTLKFLRDGMAGVVEEAGGTGGSARSKITRIGGKTGTAQVIGMKERVKSESLPKRFRDHAWFIAFAPVDDARIAVASFVEHGGHGGSVSAPLARRVIEEYMKNGIKDSRGQGIKDSSKSTQAL
ncbi:MAG: penicillin-binding protein 2 [Nitrospirota bacterium]